MNTENFFAQLMLEAKTLDIKRELNKGLEKPFEKLVKIIGLDENGFKIFAPSLCNN